METQKIFMFFMTAILALTMVSAADFTVSSSTITLSESNPSDIITISGNASEVNVLTQPTAVSDSLGTTITPSVSPVSGQTITVAENGNINYDNLLTGKIYSSSFIVGNTTNNMTLTARYIGSFCEVGAVNDTQLELDVSIDVDSEGDGDDDKWYPRDIVEVEVDFDNNFEDLDDVYLELGLFDTDGNDIAGDLDWIEGDEKEKLGDIDDGDDDSYIFKFYVPNDVDEGDYELMIKAYEDDNEEGVCIDYDNEGEYTQSIEINKENDKDRLMYFEDLEVSPSTVECGTEVTVTTTMYNIGEDKQDAVKANLYSNQLDIDMYSDIFTKFDNDEKQEIEFTFTTPSNATEGTYKLSLVAYYNWDKDEDDDETYEDAYFDEKSDAEKISITLDGKCSDSEDADIDIGVVLSEDTPKAKAGKEVVLETTVENTGTGTANYKLALSGISSWAEATIDDNDFTLDAGESKTVEIALDIDKDVDAGEKEFTIETTYGGQTKEQTVIIDIEEGFSLGFGSIGQHFQDNWFIYTVILVDVILIVAIIVAVVRVANKPRA